MFDNIKPNELPLLARAMAQPFKDEEGIVHAAHNNTQILAKLEAVEHMLAIRKVKTLMMRKRGYQIALAGIIDNLSQELDEFSDAARDLIEAGLEVREKEVGNG